jgi:hypothetical protein
MTVYESTRDLKNDVLQRGSESTSSSAYDTQVVNYLNRVHRTLCAGASEFLPEYVEDWWWMRSKGILTLAPIIEDGTVTVTQNSTGITFSDAPTSSVAGYKFKFDTHPEVFEIDSHTAASTSATLDSAYTGDSGSGTYKLMKVSYALSSSVASLISPLIGFRNNDQIFGMSPERMDDLYPLAELSPGVPRAFALEDPQTVRFSHGGRDDGQSMRVEYRYRKTVDDLTDSSSSIPLVPIEFRHLLSDMALTYLLIDKNDDRSNAVALSARTGLAAMLKENRRRSAKMGAKTIGHIYPRPTELGTEEGVLRTSSGLIIGGPSS